MELMILNGKVIEIKPVDKKQALAQAERLMKKYNIPKENMVAELENSRRLSKLR